jgi:hypothetical protein
MIVYTMNCQIDGCYDYPKYNIIGSNEMRCNRHRTNNTVKLPQLIYNGLNYECEFNYCKKRANYADLGNNIPNMCIYHKGVNMVKLR